MGIMSAIKSGAKAAAKEESKTHSKSGDNLKSKVEAAVDEAKGASNKVGTTATTAKKAIESAVSKRAAFYEAISARRSHYDITDKLPMPKSEVTALIKKVTRVCPSSFNVQSSRVVILYGAEHQRLWDIVKAALKRVTSEEQYKASEQKVNNCFAAGAGTVLYYEDQDAVKQQQEQFPSYAANFPTFSEHHSAMVQFAVWTALAQEKIGATLQHYNELIVKDVQSAFSIPESWKLIAQMPFGEYKSPSGEKTFIPDEKRFVVRGE